MMKNKAIYIIMIVAIILGAIMIGIKGFNYGTLNSKHKRLEIIIGSNFDLKDAKKIVNDNIKTGSVTRKATLYGTTLVVDAKEFKDEEINNLLSKLNEKYSKNLSVKDMKKNEILTNLNVESLNEKTDDEIQELINQIKQQYNLEYTKEELLDTSSSVRMIEIPETNIFDILKDFISPLGVSLVIIMIYFGIRYFKLYKNAWILVPLKLACMLILNQLFLLSIIAITRIPVSTYLPSVLLLVWILQLVSETINNEKCLKEKSND